MKKARAWLDEHDVAYGFHDYKSAAEVLRKAREIAPDNGRIAKGLAKDLLYSDQLDEALQIAAKIPPAREGSVEVRPVRQLDA